MNGNSSTVTSNPCNSDWTNEEISLFYTLLAAQCNTNEASDVHDDDGIWERVASMIPGKTAQQCREQYDNKIR